MSSFAHSFICFLMHCYVSTFFGPGLTVSCEESEMNEIGALINSRRKQSLYLLSI